MCSGEPSLFNQLTGPCRRSPESRVVVRAVFINGERVVGPAHDRAELGIVKVVPRLIQPSKCIRGDSERAHRVPESEKCDGHTLEFAASRAGSSGTVGVWLCAAIASIRVPNDRA